MIHSNQSSEFTPVSKKCGRINTEPIKKKVEEYCRPLKTVIHMAQKYLHSQSTRFVSVQKELEITELV